VAAVYRRASSGHNTKPNRFFWVWFGGDSFMLVFETEFE
jgi:hypothetical protein